MEPTITVATVSPTPVHSASKREAIARDAMVVSSGPFSSEAGDWGRRTSRLNAGTLDGQPTNLQTPRLAGIGTAPFKDTRNTSVPTGARCKRSYAITAAPDAAHATLTLTIVRCRPPPCLPEYGPAQPKTNRTPGLSDDLAESRSITE